MRYLTNVGVRKKKTSGLGGWLAVKTRVGIDKDSGRDEWMEERKEERRKEGKKERKGRVKKVFEKEVVFNRRG